MKRRTHGLIVGDVAFAVLPDGRVRVLTAGGTVWYPSLSAFIRATLSEQTPRRCSAER